MQILAKNIKKSIAISGILKDSEKALVALSGGADSVCLLIILRELGYKIEAAHCNFHLRGEESMRDERFVRELCERLNIELHVADFNTKEWAEKEKQSIELAARNLRYDFFKKVMDERGLDVLAVGHHADDNVETFLLNATRRTGMRGLCGIKARSVNAQGCTLVRPLLSVRHKEIEEALKSFGQDWVVDSTNEELDAARNKIRHGVVPVLESVNHAAVKNICKTMENIEEMMKIYEAEMERCKKMCVKTSSDGTIIINREKLAQCTSPISVLHEILTPLGFNTTQVENMLTAKGYRCNRKKGEKEMTLPGGKGKVNVDIGWKEITICKSE